MTHIEHEEWKDVVGYEGYYMISNLGNLMSLDRYVVTSTGILRPIKAQVMKTRIRNGYVIARLRKGNGGKTVLLHRLIATAFIPNPDNKATVNHINGIKSDNRISNLCWHTAQENSQHAVDTGLRKPPPNCKKVLDSCTGSQYHSIQQAAKDSCISKSRCRKMIKLGQCFELI